MDQFVRDQLTLADCAHLIPLFRDKGYDEAAFRKLTMPKLAYLLPDDKEYRLVLSIWSTIMCLDPAPVSSSSTGFLPPPPVVIVKTSPLKHETGQPIAPPQDDHDEGLMVSDNDTICAPPLKNVAHGAEQATAQDDDDEVQIVQELERIDVYVKYQLTLIGCEGLIELFRGYNEEEYRKLNIRKLMELLPDDEDGGLALKIMDSIRWLNTPDHDRSTHPGAPFPPPTVVVKTEPLETGPEEGDDDEVQIVGRTIRAPSGFTVVEIKQERPEQISENGHAPQSSSSSSISQPSVPSISDSNCNETVNSGEIPADNTLAEGAGNEGNAATTDAAQDNGCSDNGGHSRRNRGSRKRGGEPMTMNATGSQPKAKRSKEAESSWRKFIDLTFGQTSTKTRLTKAKLEERFGDKLEFKLSATTHLDDVLRLIETYSGRLRHFVKQLTLTIPTADDDVISISSQHLRRLANLPEAFLNQLTKLTFNLRFPESTDFTLITTLLSRCPSLEAFEVQRGVVLNGDEAVSFKVPKMDKLVSFAYLTSIELTGPRYQQPPTPAPVDVETDKCVRNLRNPTLFQVNFSNLTFPALEELLIGPFIELEFETLSQFPKLKGFNPGHVSGIRALPWVSTESTCEPVTYTGLYGMAKMELIQQISQAFPNLTQLRLTLPSVSTFRSVINKMADMRIEYFEASVNFEFESAFLAAFYGHPFKLATDHDRLKFDKLQMYKHWKGFMKHLGIDIPKDEDEASTSEEESNYHDGETRENYMLSSFKFLKYFNLRHIMANIYLPENDTHWSNPDVQLSSSRWSSIRQRFPSTILLEKLSKLKGQLQSVNLKGFEVGQDTIVQFQEIVGFKINFGQWCSTINLDRDTVSSTDLRAKKLEN